MCDTKNYEQTWREATNVSTARTDGDILANYGESGTESDNVNFSPTLSTIHERI